MNMYAGSCPVAAQDAGSHAHSTEFARRSQAQGLAIIPDTRVSWTSSKKAGLQPGAPGCGEHISRQEGVKQDVSKHKRLRLAKFLDYNLKSYFFHLSDNRKFKNLNKLRSCEKKGFTINICTFYDTFFYSLNKRDHIFNMHLAQVWYPAGILGVGLHSWQHSKSSFGGPWEPGSGKWCCWQQAMRVCWGRPGPTQV